MCSLRGTVSPVPPSPRPVQQSWLEQGAQAVSGKQAEEGASQLPGQNLDLELLGAGSPACESQG